MPRPRLVHAFSAGGIIFRVATSAASASHADQGCGVQTPAHDNAPDATSSMLEGVEVVLVGFLRDDTWTLPKGTPATGETVEETALREVREETGIEARIVGDLGSIQYSFSRRGVRFNKEVHHFLMEATGGDVVLHDAEYDEARWFAFADALERVTYANEAEVLRRAGRMIEQRLAGEDA